MGSTEYFALAGLLLSLVVSGLKWLLAQAGVRLEGGAAYWLTFMLSVVTAAVVRSTPTRVGNTCS